MIGSNIGPGHLKRLILVGNGCVLALQTDKALPVAQKSPKPKMCFKRSVQAPAAGNLTLNF